jgi:hypothetical protein
MISAVLGFFGSAAFGGLTGLFGGIVNRVADYFTLKQNNTHNEKMRDKDLEISKVEAQKDLAIARDANYTSREIADQESLQESLQADKATYLTQDLQKDVPSWARGPIAIAMAFVDLIRGLTRPGITLYMCILTTLIWVEMNALLSKYDTQPMKPEDAVKIIIMIVDGIIYLTSMCVGWWFGSRGKKIKEG